MTPSEIATIAAALAGVNAALDRCLARIHQQHSPPPTGAGLIRRADHQEPNHG